ncbi:MAG: YciI family protein [Acidobacteriota bacterium]|nr:YciI family protein [Acidobacteriota bacterium]
MKYILMIYGNESEWDAMSAADQQKMYEAHGAYSEALEKAGVMRGGYELKPAATATTLRFDNGKATTLDGPFAETKEQLGGYYVIEVDNLEQALDWASKMPGMDSGAVEVRPLGMGG